MDADRAIIRDWLHFLHGKSHGLLHVCGDRDWTGRRYPTTQLDDAVTYILTRDRARRQGTYLRVTTLTENAPTDDGKRAGAMWSASFPGLWADIDIAGPGHKHKPNHPDLPGYDPRSVLVHPLPADEETARRIVDEAGLLKPTLWIHSGGGLYPWWLLEQPETLEGDSFALEAATTLSEGWQRELETAANRLGVDYGNVGDLARVMRIPGSVNRKAGLERPCRVLENDGPRYSFDNLVSCLADVRQAREAREERERPAAVPAPQQIQVAPPVDRAGSPLAAFEATVPWSAILEPHDWTVAFIRGATTYWTRPGKATAEGYSATTGHSNDGHDRLFVFSTSCGLPVREPLTKPYVWGILNGHQDMKAVAKALVNMGFGTPVASPTPIGTTTQLAPLPPSQPGVSATAPVPAVLPSPIVTAPQPAQWCPTPQLPGASSPLPPFPVTALPPVMRDLVEQVAGSRQVDPTLPAMFALSAVSAVAAGKWQVYAGEDWFEALSLYTCAVAESGERKSPTGRPVFQPIERIEDRRQLVHADEVDRKIDELDQQRAAVGRNPAAANRLEDQIAKLEASRSRPPRLRLADDITPEALVRSLAAAGGHGAILDPEGTFLGQLSGRYSSGQPNPELVIKAYDGDSYTSERISRESDRIGRPTLAIGVAVQNTVLEELMASKQLLERGALARFMWAFPASLVGRRWVRDAVPYDPAPGRAWSIVLEGISEEDVPEGSVASIALSPAASARFIALRDHVESRLAPGGDLTAVGLKEWSHKHAGRVLRIAALLHLVAGFTHTTEIQLQVMESAIAIGEWAIAHARHAHGINPETDEEATIKQTRQTLDWIVRTGQQAFTRRDACRAMKAQWVNSKSMADALDQLAELGWVREEPYQDKANRWRTRYGVSPNIALAREPATM